jgi:hypothetical protein
MATKTKTSPPAAKKPLPKPVLEGVTLKPPYTLEERLHRIEALGKRMDGYIKYMCQIATQAGSSNEAKERAVTLFYNQLVIVESQLAKIHDELRLE